jgi:DNA (cytosine-5)-methyltransferase 1
MAYRDNHPNLIPQTRELLQATGLPHVIENVGNVRAHLMNPVMLCGSMFGLQVWRHRYFETWPFQFLSPATCKHDYIPVLISGTTRRRGYKRVDPPVALRREAIGIDWMMISELDQAIPPAYTEWLGAHLLLCLQREATP